VGNSDTSTETGWLAKQFINSPKLPMKVYMDAGTFEYEYDTWEAAAVFWSPIGRSVMCRWPRGTKFITSSL
jgi:hypothetical protein